MVERTSVAFAAPLASVEPMPITPDAPIIYADGVTAGGLQNGLLFLTFEATTFFKEADGTSIAIRRQPVVHMRLPLAGISSLEEAIQQAKFALAPAQGQRQ